jgi:hypothetical protein
VKTDTAEVKPGLTHFPSNLELNYYIFIKNKQGIKAMGTMNCFIISFPIHVEKKEWQGSSGKN